MPRHLCNHCDDDWSDDVDGYCTSCREELELRREIEAMSAEEYERFKARHFNAAYHAIKVA